jgi:anaphase-promoting complex subunit 5
MTRYLTPSKICLLVLTCLYCDDFAAHDATIPVLSFIVSSVNHSAATAASGHKSKGPLPGIISLEDFERLLTQQQSKITGRTLWDFLLHRIWSIDCLHALHQFFAELGNYLANDQERPHTATSNNAESTNRILLSPVSPLGIFIRKAQLEFTRLQFHDSVGLWTALVRFRASTEAAWKRRHPTTSSSVPDINLHSLGHDIDEVFSQILYGSLQDTPSEEGFLSTEDIERVLEFQLNRLQSTQNTRHVKKKI